MMVLFELLLTNIFFLIGSVLFSSVVAYLMLPRLELAKGIVGSKGKLSAGVAYVFTKTIWNNKEITWKSPWILVLGIQSTYTTILLSPIFFNSWEEFISLAVPTLFAFERLMVSFLNYREKGEKHPLVRSFALTTTAGTTGLCLILYGIFNNNFSETGFAWAGITAKWAVLFLLYIALTPFLTYSNTAREVPIVVRRISEVAWAIGASVMFFHPILTSPILGAIEQFIKAIFLLACHDVIRKVFSTFKPRFYENYLANLVIPLLIVASIAVVLGY